ncbi:type I toxin-antitoxin system Ibs family toxin [Escherichia coli]|nr:type I toxin-antitoxin system Ibs family toxin [Escherichia coli]NAC63071.1 type I toxin-antitoxin system Ibs family toxin [Escherichia coli]HAX4854394.1 type I toxin-antitoxin system Ibs family toxin [Escherichia coli]HAX4914397.1 type I toxin-antitoxin system Ibs family toxin [Escherichia coli]
MMKRIIIVVLLVISFPAY